jgi:DNA-binding transcriptional ArsR family regulator
MYNHMVVSQLSNRDVDRVFRALADATRRDIFQRVMGSGLSVSTLANDYQMSFAAVQKHVSVLERAQLVSKERHGREQIVRGNVATLRRATALLDAFEEIWIGRATRIAEILGEEGSAS